jgi:hypothetical protein
LASETHSITALKVRAIYEPDAFSGFFTSRFPSQDAGFSAFQFFIGFNNKMLGDVFSVICMTKDLM